MLTIYHNPRCSKSRQTLTLIEENNQEVCIVEYFETLDTNKQTFLLEQANNPVICLQWLLRPSPLMYLQKL